MTEFVIRPATMEDRDAAYRVCLLTGDHGSNGEPYYRDDPDALGRIYVGPYLVFEPALSLVIEDATGVCGYALAALDSRTFYERYETDWRPSLSERFPEPAGDPSGWTRVEQVYYAYHHPDHFCPEPYELYPSHLHIDLLPHVRGQGYGRKMVERLLGALASQGSPGVHLAVSALNMPAQVFYRRLGFAELTRTVSGGDEVIYMGRKLAS